MQHQTSMNVPIPIIQLKQSLACILTIESFKNWNYTEMYNKITASNFLLYRTTQMIARQSIGVAKNNTIKKLVTKSLFTSCATSSSSPSTQFHHHQQQLPRTQKDIHHQQQLQQVRYLGRKAGKMGKHLETLNEIAHREEHEKAKQKRKKNKKSKRKNHDNYDEQEVEAQAAETRMSNNEIQFIQEDETETIFDHGGNDDDDDVPSLPTTDEVKGRMMKVVNAMKESFKAIRGAEATPELFDTVQVKAYGAMTPLNGVAQVVISTPTRATITCFDPELSPAVRDAVRDMAGMNFNPSIEEGVVVVPIPRVSAETRKVRKDSEIGALFIVTWNLYSLTISSITLLV